MWTAVQIIWFEKNYKDLLYGHKDSRLGSAGMETVVTGPGGLAMGIFEESFSLSDTDMNIMSSNKT